MITHGKASNVSNGVCRCEQCQEANRRYRHAYYRRLTEAGICHQCGRLKSDKVTIAGVRLRSVPKTLTVDEVNWVRLAAFIDGEGTIVSSGNKRSGRIRVDITNTDFRLMEWLRATFGGNVVLVKRRKPNPKSAPLFVWQICAATAADVLRAIKPYLLLKGRRAEIALELQATKQASGKRIPLDVLNARWRLRSELRLLNRKGPRVA